MVDDFFAELITGEINSDVCDVCLVILLSDLFEILQLINGICD